MAKEKNAQKEDVKVAKESKKDTAEKAPGKAKYIVAIIFIVIIIGVAIFAGSTLSTQGNNFNAFKQNFDTAPRVDLFVAAYNGTVLSSTIGCATSIIEQIIASKTNHRAPSTIDFNIINKTSCIRSPGLSSNSSTSNYITTSLQNCLNTSNTEPSIFINYSSTNVTIIKPRSLYISGTLIFLRECGIASQLS